MYKYEQIIEGACAAVETSCASCGRFLAKTASSLVPVDDGRLGLFKSSQGVLQLDTCAIVDSCYRFCQECVSALNRRRSPKFSALNAMNVSFCQEYPSELEDLTLTEEYVIARSHPIGTILKLRPNGLPCPVAYNAIRGHLVAIPQDPGPLLNILPSADLRFHDHIGVVWSSKTLPTAEDLRPFVQVRKDKVMRALLWLCQNTPLYQSVEINHDLLDQWSESFIPQDLLDTIGIVDAAEDSAERGTYTVDMDGLSENDLHAALNTMADDAIASAAVYSDIDGDRLNPELKMVMTLMAMIDEGEDLGSVSDGQKEVEVPVIVWESNGRRVLMNDYEDRGYFTAAFPTLFPYGKGGHIPGPDEGHTPVSLEAWAKWLLSHHSRRQVILCG
jgi:hypothetical protein